MPFIIVPIVEGKGEKQALPVLIRRILNERMGIYCVKIEKPGPPVHRNKLTHEEEIEKAVGLAMRRSRCDAVVFLIDADDDCPKEIGPIMRTRASSRAQTLPVIFRMAKREMEAWLIGNIESLRGIRGISEGAVRPKNPESIRGCKDWLTRAMKGGRTYTPTDDQAAMFARMDIDPDRNACDSYKRFYRDLEHLSVHIHTSSQCGSDTVDESGKP